MNRMKGSSRAKRIVAAVVMAAVAFGFVFASPLNLEGPLGNARIYDGSFKSVANPTTVDESWIVRTFDNEVLLGNDAMSMNIGTGSLVQILNLSDAPVVYLLDGWVAVEIASGDVQIKTPAALYSAQQGTTLVVTSTAQTEDAYVHTGFASAQDTITDTKADVPAGSYVNATSEGFQSLTPTDGALEKAALPAVAQAAEDPVAEEPVAEETAVEEQATEETAEEEPVAEETIEETIEESAEEPAEEPAVQAVEETAPAVETKPLVKTLSYAGYEATITAYIGKAYIEYPSFVTSQEIYTAAAAALAAYPSELEGVTIRVAEAGLAEITYPKAYGEREFDYAVALLEKELPYYIASLFAPKSPSEPVVATVAETAVEEQATEETAEEEPVIEETIQETPEESAEESAVQAVEETSPAVETKPLVKTLSYAGYEATITAYIGKAYIEYPSFVTSQEIYTAAAAALAAYPSELEGVTIRVAEAGLAEITYPKAYGEREFDYAIALLEKELPYYIASLFAPKTPSEPVVATVETDPKPVEETSSAIEPQAPALDGDAVVEMEETPETSAQPALEVEDVAEPVKKPVAPTVQAAVPQANDEASSVRFGATVAVEYGLPNEKATYYGFVNGDAFKVGTFTKNIMVAVDPYVAIGNFTFGLHIAVNTSDVMSSFSFGKDNGIAGYVSSIAKYLGRIGYRSEAGTIDIAVDRTHEFKFASPIAGSFDRDFDTTARLVASFEGKFGIVGVTAFMDDLELANKLDGKKQFAGLRVAVDAGPVEVGVSAAADIRNLDILGKQYETEIYPAIDVNVPLSIGSTDIDVVLGGATNITVGSAVDFATLPYLAKLSATVSKDLYHVGAGIAYNKGNHLNGIVGNSLATISKPFADQSIDALFNAGLRWGVLSIDTSFNVPFSLNKDDGELLAYNEVIARSGATAKISADTFKFKASLSFGGFSLNGGVMFDGFCGRVADLAKVLANKEDATDAVAGIQDPDLAMYFIGMSYGIGGLEAHIKGNYMALEDEGTAIRALVLSVGGSYSF